MAGHLCPWWCAYTFDNPLRGLVHQPEKILGPYVRPGMRCLDLGCGLGFFSLALARLTGPQGLVAAVDLQWQMLRGLKKRAAKAGLDGIIEPRQCRVDDLDISDLAGGMDFALAFYMIHEVPRPAEFLRQVSRALKPGAAFMIVEPLLHVTAAEFRRTLDMTGHCGFVGNERPKVRLSRAAILRRA